MPTPVRRTAPARARPILGLTAVPLLAALLLAGTPRAEAGKEAATGDSEAAATGSDTAATGSDAAADGDRASAGQPDAEADATSGEPHLSGSWTLRAGFREGKGNDRHSARLSLEWGAGRWSGGLSAEGDSALVEGSVHSEPGVGSFDLSERWIGFTHRARSFGIGARLGTSFGLRHGEGLILGAPTFDGLTLDVDLGRRTRLALLAGRTEAVDPQDFLDEPLELFPEEEFLGSDGELAGVRLEVDAAPALTVGMSALATRGQGTPTARLASVDFAFSRGMVDLSGELARRDAGGHAVYLRADVTPSERVGVSIERRRYVDFVSPLGNAPLYTGLSAGSEEDEDGWLVRVDLSPTDRTVLSLSTDYSQGGVKGDGPVATVRRTHRLELSQALTRRTSLTYGFEFEDLSGGRDGAVHGLLVTHAFDGGGRLAGRLSVDRSSPGHRTTARVNYRLPLRGRRITLLFDDTLRLEGGRALNTLQVGSSLRLGRASHLTVRGTLADGEPDGLEITWYRRF